MVKIGIHERASILAEAHDLGARWKPALQLAGRSPGGPWLNLLPFEGGYEATSLKAHNKERKRIMPHPPRPMTGQPYRLPHREQVTADRVGPLVADLGPGWKDCAQVQPWQDTVSALRYVVYSPSYIGTLLLCRFDLFSPARWWHEGMQVGISGVTHWRLATEADQDFSELDPPLVVTPPNAEALAQLLHWWGWYRQYKGFNDHE